MKRIPGSWNGSPLRGYDSPVHGYGSPVRGIILRVLETALQDKETAFLEKRMAAPVEKKISMNVRAVPRVEEPFKSLKE